MTNETSQQRVYDLYKRTGELAIKTIVVLRSIPQDAITKPMIVQLVRSVTSIGANYAEADGAGSRRDFMYKLSICRKESRESAYWLEIISSSYPMLKERMHPLAQESMALARIFSSIIAQR